MSRIMDRCWRVLAWTMRDGGAVQGRRERNRRVASKAEGSVPVPKWMQNGSTVVSSVLCMAYKIHCSADLNSGLIQKRDVP